MYNVLRRFVIQIKLNQFKKCPYTYHALSYQQSAYLSTITVTNISESFKLTYKMAAKINSGIDMEQTNVTSCHSLYVRVYTSRVTESDRVQ